VAALTSELTNLSEFTHIAFTSKNGIHAVLAQLERMHGSTMAARTAVAASGVRICALGADASVLRDAGYPVHLLPSEPSTQGMVSELRRRKEAAGARVLCPVPKVTGMPYFTPL
jgi:uroporphyrinogen-III synthase